MSHTLILLRHGQSVWNKENRFTGWVDVPLSEQGKNEAHQAAELLVESKIVPDVMYTSILRRGINTAEAVNAAYRNTIPVFQSWRLNERHYGGLQGLNKSEIAEKFGEEQVHIWRRSFDVRPPELSEEAFRIECADPVYASVPVADHPKCEALKDTILRTLPYWEHTIRPEIEKGKTVCIAGHHNSLRAIVKVIETISDDGINDVILPTGAPLKYEFDDAMIIKEKKFLGDPETIEAAIRAVNNQGKHA